MEASPSFPSKLAPQDLDERKVGSTASSRNSRILRRAHFHRRASSLSSSSSFKEQERTDDSSEQGSFSSTYQKKTHRRKRKSDEINFLFDPPLQNPNEKHALQSDDVFFDMKPRWRRAYMQELHHQESSKNMDMVLLCPDEEDRQAPIEIIRSERDDAKKEKGPFQTYFMEPNTPTFRSLASGHAQQTSPTGVIDEFDCGRVYFWHRSLAWSEDFEENSDDDDDDSSDGDRKVCNTRTTPNDILRHLSVPEKLGKEFASDIEGTRGLEGHQQALIKFTFDSNEEVDHFRCPGSSVTCQQTDTHDHTVEIHWEEKVFDSIDLERMAKLII